MNDESTLELNGKTYRAVMALNGCKGCALKGTHGCVKLKPPCYWMDRKDGTSIIWKEAENERNDFTGIAVGNTKDAAVQTWNKGVEEVKG